MTYYVTKKRSKRKSRVRRPSYRRSRVRRPSYRRSRVRRPSYRRSRVRRPSYRRSKRKSRKRRSSPRRVSNPEFKQFFNLKDMFLPISENQFNINDMFHPINNNINDVIIPSGKLYISGPFTLSYHISNNFNKKIYIFGESHGHSDNCDNLMLQPNITITNFFNMLFKENSKFSQVSNNLVVSNKPMIDFYLETTETFYDCNIKYFSSCSNYLDELRVLMKYCIEQKARHNCQYTNMRAHYIDVRYILNSDKNDIWVGLLTNDNPTIVFSYVHKQKIIETINMFFTKNFGSYLISQIFQSSIYKVKKEIERSIFSKDNYVNFINIIIRDNPKYKKIVVKKHNYTDKELNFFMFKISSLIVDIYQIARIFKNFKNTDHPTPNNVITYTGESHAISLRLVLNYLRFNTIKKIETNVRNVKTPRCLDTSGFLPLFK